MYFIKIFQVVSSLKVYTFFGLSDAYYIPRPVRVHQLDHLKIFLFAKE